MPRAEPVFLPGNKTGFIFIHGFTGASYEGWELAHRLHEKEGFTVSVPLLPLIEDASQPSADDPQDGPQYVDSWPEGPPAGSG